MDILNNPKVLKTLYQMLDHLADEIDDEENVPERFMSSGKSVIAEYEADRIKAARYTIHLLLLRAEHPSVHQTTDYVKREVEVG